MVSAKDIIIKPIKAKAANELVKRVHYSGKVVPNSQLHFGAFLDGKLEGVMSFGPSMDKKGTISLVRGTNWNAFLELNRMAFSDRLPRNSESRCMAIAFKLIKKHYPHIEWVLSFSDGTQCGDGTIYRAAGFFLTRVKKNTSVWQHTVTGEQRQNMQFFHTGTTKEKRSGDWVQIPGFQLRYIYFLNKSAIDRLTVPVLPFSKIDEIGAGMYKGQSCTLQSRRVTKATSSDQLESGGAIPTNALHIQKDHPHG